MNFDMIFSLKIKELGRDTSLRLGGLGRALGFGTCPSSEHGLVKGTCKMNCNGQTGECTETLEITSCDCTGGSRIETSRTNFQVFKFYWVTFCINRSQISEWQSELKQNYTLALRFGLNKRLLS